MKIKKIVRFLGVLDLFQQNVSLKLYNRYRVSITLGKALTIGIFLFILYNFFVSDMVKGTNPFVLQQLVQAEKRPEFNFNKENFAFSFAIVDANNIIVNDPTIFNFLAISMSAENGQNTQQRMVPTETCTSEYFQRFPGFYEASNLTQATCIKNTNFSLRGYWDEERVEQLNVLVTKCINYTKSPIICKSLEEIESFFQEKFFSFWIEDKSFDMNDYDNPIKSKIKYFSRTIETTRTKGIRLFMRESSLILDNGIIYAHENQIKTFSIGNMEFDESKSETNVFALLIYSSDIKQIFQRRYQKLFDLLASLGGILNVLLIFGSIIVKYFYEWEINELILNKLYVLADNLGNLKNNKNNLVENKSKSNTSKVVPRTNQSYKLFNLGKIKMSFLERIMLFAKKKRKRTRKENLYTDYLAKCNKKMDLIEIIKKLEEIEKIKRILFDEKQLSIFNMMTKQYLYLSETQRAETTFKFSMDYKKGGAGIDSSISDSTLNNYIYAAKNDKNTNWFEKRLLGLVD